MINGPLMPTHAIQRHILQRLTAVFCGNCMCYAAIILSQINNSIQTLFPYTKVDHDAQYRDLLIRIRVDRMFEQFSRQPTDLFGWTVQAKTHSRPEFLVQERPAAGAMPAQQATALLARVCEIALPCWNYVKSDRRLNADVAETTMGYPDRSRVINKANSELTTLIRSLTRLTLSGPRIPSEGSNG